MNDLYGTYPLSELNYQTPFQLLTAVVLSAQTTDKQVNKVTESLFVLVKTPADMVALGEERLGELIQTVGLRKSKKTHLFRLATLLAVEQHPVDMPLDDIRQDDIWYNSSDELFAVWGYHIPDTIAKLTQLPGVGIKTAKVVLYILYRQYLVAVDTHVHRVMNRLGIVQTTSPEKTSDQLEDIIPHEYKPLAHKVIIYFGRYWCTAKKPHCTDCLLASRCPRGKTVLQEK